MPGPEVGKALLQHAYNEFTYLSRFLPSLFLAEHRDERPPVVPGEPFSGGRRRRTALGG